MQERLLDSFLGRVVRRYVAANGGTWATAISWNALFAFFPIILAIVTILGLVLGGTGLSASVERTLAQAIPGQQGALILQALRSFHQAAGPLLAVSFLGLVWSGSSLFGAIEQGLDALYRVPQRGFVRQKGVALLMILLFTVLVVPATSSASLLAVVARLPGIPGFLSSGPLALLLQIGFGVLDGAVLFGAIYYVMPNRRQRLGEVLPGAVAAAALLELFVLVFPLYFSVQHGFSTYGSTFALFFLLMTLAFWFAQILVIGGAVNAELNPPPVESSPSPELPFPADVPRAGDTTVLRGGAVASRHQAEPVRRSSADTPPPSITTVGGCWSANPRTPGSARS